MYVGECVSKVRYRNVFVGFFYYLYMLKFLYCIFYMQHLNAHKNSIVFFVVV